MQDFTRRERQIIEILLRLGKCTAQQVREQLPDEPSYSTVRTLLRILSEKQHVKAKLVAGRYVYEPAVSKDRTARTTLKQLLDTFYGNSAEKAIAAILATTRPGRDELSRIATLVADARGKRS